MEKSSYLRPALATCMSVRICMEKSSYLHPALATCIRICMEKSSYLRPASLCLCGSLSVCDLWVDVFKQDHQAAGLIVSEIFLRNLEYQLFFRRNIKEKISLLSLCPFPVTPSHQYRTDTLRKMVPLENIKAKRP